MNRDRLFSGVLTPFLAAFFGAILGAMSTILVTQYERAFSREDLRVALTGEIESILFAIRFPALRTSWAWEGTGEGIKRHEFYYPTSVFSGNVANLGALRDPKLVRRITSLYSELEMAREEGRRLDSGTNDSDAAFRYAHFLFGAYLNSIQLVQELTGDIPIVYPAAVPINRKVNAEAITRDLEHMTKARKILNQAAIEGSRPPVRKEQRASKK